MNSRVCKVASAVLAGAMGLSLVGCETKAQTGALAGGAGGAGVGAIIGHQSGHAGEGALIGAAVGAIGGAIVGNEMDKADQRKRDRAYEQANRQNREARYYEGAPAQRLSTDDVIAWTKNGEKDEIIIDRVQRSGSVFHMTAADENRLRDAGVSEEVVRAMKNTAR